MPNIIEGRLIRVSAFGLVLCLIDTVPLPGAKAQAGDVRRTFEVPRVEGIEVDGKADDWTGKGHGFEILLPQHGKHRKAEDHNASITLGWTQEGLLFLVRVQQGLSQPADRSGGGGMGYPIRRTPDPPNAVHGQVLCG